MARYGCTCSFWTTPPCTLFSNPIGMHVHPTPKEHVCNYYCLQEPDGEVRAHVRFLDDTTFEVVASHTLAPREDVCSLAALPYTCPPPPPGQQGPAAGEVRGFRGVAGASRAMR